MALDEFQLAAARSRMRSQLVLAGPGAGKTLTLTKRFAYLVDSGVDPRRIAAFTFTRKAAEEMQRRIGRELRYDDRRLRQLTISTFHSFCNSRIIGLAPERCGVQPGYAIWMSGEQRQAFVRAGLWWNQDQAITDIISAAKERLIDVDAYESNAAEGGDQLARKAAPFFRAYEEAKREAGALDMSDLLLRSVRLLQADEGFAERIIGAFDHLLVDEYQDINSAQMGLIQEFTKRGVALWAVGDDDQMLYGFRAADVRYILDFQEHYPDAEIHVLRRNYRAPSLLVDRAKRLISHNTHRYSKDLEAAPRRGGEASFDGEIIVRRFSAPEIEAAEIGRSIRHLLDVGIEPRRIAVLYRMSDVGLAMQSAMTARGIPHEMRGAVDLWGGFKSKLVLGTLYCLREGESERAKWYLGSSWRAKEIMRQARLVRSARTAEGPVITDFIGLWQHAKRLLEPLAGSKACLREMIEWRLQIETILAAIVDCPGIEDVVKRMKDQSRSLKVPPKDSVVFSTIHGAKGLEYDFVFLAGMEDNVCPHDLSDDIEEERRIAYVGVTRARRGLAVTSVSYRGGKEAAESRFIHEMLGNPEVKAQDFEFADAGGDTMVMARPASSARVSGRVDVNFEVLHGDEVGAAIIFRDIEASRS